MPSRIVLRYFCMKLLVYAVVLGFFVLKRKVDLVVRLSFGSLVVNGWWLSARTRLSVLVFVVSRSSSIGFIL